MQIFKSIPVVAAGLSLASAVALNVDDPASIKSAAASVVYDMLKTYYTGNLSANPTDYGVLPKPYYWWEAGAMFGALVDYSHYTGDSSYDEMVSKAIISQESPQFSFNMTATQLDNLGNDDILFWALTAMNAAEYNFVVPAGSSPDIYFQLSRNVFNVMVDRWNTTTCGGGLKWQWFTGNNGFYYKSTITNSAFFQLAARLGRMTGNSTYTDWATKTYDWMVATKFIDNNYFVYDGAGDAGTDNCKAVDPHQWSYNIGSTLAGAAHMYAATKNEIWRTRTHGFLQAVQVNFVTPFANSTNVLYERQCENNVCNNDQLSFKGYLARWLAMSSVVLPEIKPAVQTILKASAQAAAKTCTGGTTGLTCGERWWVGGYDGTQNLGPQLTAIETFQSLLIWSVSGPISRSDSGVASPPPPPASTSKTSTKSTTKSATTSTIAPTTLQTSITASKTAVAAPLVALGTTTAKPATNTDLSVVAGSSTDGFLATNGMPVADCMCMPASS